MRRRGFTLVETLVAVATAGVLIAGMAAGVRFFTRPMGDGALTLDAVQDLTLGTESIERDVREARRIIWPKPGDEPARSLFLRTFEGKIATWYYDAKKKQLVRAVVSPEDALEPPRRIGELDGVYFACNRDGLVSWGLFVRENGLMGAARRQNQ